jgi:hypothetical protein
VCCGNQKSGWQGGAHCHWPESGSLGQLFHAKMSNSAVDRDRLEAYQRKMNNPAEMLVGNVVIGSMIGMFVGYMSGAAFGVYKWKRECPSRRRIPTAPLCVHSSYIQTMGHPHLCTNIQRRHITVSSGTPSGKRVPQTFPLASLRSSHTSPSPPTTKHLLPFPSPSSFSECGCQDDIIGGWNRNPDRRRRQRILHDAKGWLCFEFPSRRLAAAQAQGSHRVAAGPRVHQAEGEGDGREHGASKEGGQGNACQRRKDGGHEKTITPGERGGAGVRGRMVVPFGDGHNV